MIIWKQFFSHPHLGLEVGQLGLGAGGGDGRGPGRGPPRPRPRPRGVRHLTDGGQAAAVLQNLLIVLLEALGKYGIVALIFRTIKI